MSLIEANRLHATIPGDREHEPDPAVTRQRLERALADAYGYLPPIEEVVAHGWSPSSTIAGRTAAGWRYEALVPRHLGPAPATVARSRAHHPAGGSRRPGA